MAKIKEHYFGFWAEGKPFYGDWYDGFVSEWHGPLGPFRYVRRYYRDFGYSFLLIMFYPIISIIWINRLHWFYLSITSIVSIFVDCLFARNYFQKTYNQFSFCPECQFGLLTSDIYRGFMNHLSAGSFQRCPGCGFEREIGTMLFMPLPMPLLEHISKMYEQTIPYPKSDS